MDQKRAMLYPPIEPAANEAARDQRMSAIGLPTEAPPSYDMAVASTSSTAPAQPAKAGWQPSAPAAMPEIIVQAQPTPQPQPQPQSQPPPPQQSYSQQRHYNKRRHHKRHDEPTSSVIVEQPTAQPQPQPQPALPYVQQHQLPTTVTSAVPAKLGPNPCAVTCPACGTNKTTRMTHTPNTRTHISALILCLVGWCCCACLVPYCMNSCRTGNHYCSKCNTFLGTYNPRDRRK